MKDNLDTFTVGGELMEKTALLALLPFSLSLLAFGCASQGSCSEELVERKGCAPLWQGGIY
jgi:hypothetical protein